MSYLIALAAWSLIGFGAALFVVLMIAHEFGLLAGRRRAARGDPPSESVGVVVGGVLGLLGFVLALTLSFASTRFNDRRADALAEANAIGTAWLRAEAIGEPRGAEIARLLEQYTRLRADFAKAPADQLLIADLNRQTNAMQTRIWGHVAAIVRERKDPIAASLMAAVNDTFDMASAQRFAFELRIAPQVIWLLLGLAVLGMGALGYQLGLKGNSLRTLVVLMTLMWTVLIVDILDLGAARIGAVRTPTNIYNWTLQGFQGGVPIPPAPASQ